MKKIMKTMTNPTDLCLQAISRETAAFGLPILRENRKISKLFQAVAAAWLLTAAGSLTAASVTKRAAVVISPTRLTNGKKLIPIMTATTWWRVTPSPL